MKLVLIALFFAIAIKATEVFVCYYDDFGRYQCDLITDEKPTSSETDILIYEQVDLRMKK